MIATGVAADGSDTITETGAKRPGFLPSQRLANPPHDNPATKDQVADWLTARVAADQQMRTALRERTPVPPEIDPELERDSDDAISVLGRQHNQVSYLLKELQALHSHTGGSAGQIAARKSIIDMITVRLTRHETIEEERFRPTVRKAVPADPQCPRAETGFRHGA